MALFDGARNRTHALSESRRQDLGKFLWSQKPTQTRWYGRAGTGVILYGWPPPNLFSGRSQRRCPRSASSSASSLPRSSDAAGFGPNRSPPRGEPAVPEPVEAGRAYLAGLDGLRAVAVLAVLLYHLEVRLLPGGLLGVGVFFVLSGYLITDLLVSEWDRSGQIRLGRFWARRARRLLPALALLLLAVLAWFAVRGPGSWYGIPGQILAAALYISNWWDIFQHVPYFARFGPPSPLGHLWSLAVEEQFYLVWPFVLWAGLRLFPRRRWLVLTALAGAALSAFLMGWLYIPGGNPDRVYYGTDTRAFALLLGAALALACPSRRLTALQGPRAARWLDAGGLFALLALGALMVGTNAYQPWLYPYGMLCLSLVTLLAIVAAAHPKTWVSRLLGSRPLRWLGVRSYGVYLWHYPVIVFTIPVQPVSSWAWARALAQIAATLLVAQASWRYLEDPIRHRLPWPGPIAALRRPWATSLAALAFSALLALDLVGLVHLVQGRPVADAAPPSAVPATATLPRLPSQGTPAPSSAEPASAPSSATARAQAATASAFPQLGHGVTAIGDSVILDAAPYLQQFLPGIVVDGKVGRQLYELGGVLSRLRAQRRLGSRVIIELGTNGPFPASLLLDDLKALGPYRQVVLVTTRVPRPWQDVVNAALHQVAQQAPRVTLVHWHKLSAGHPSYFYPDGVHLTPAGSLVYAHLLAQALYPGRPSAPSAGP